MIVAAAHKMPDGRVLALPAPTRHGEVFNVAMEDIGMIAGIGEYSHSDCWQSEQGFIDSNEGFVDRIRANDIVIECNQPVQPGFIYEKGKMLFSEDLW